MSLVHQFPLRATILPTMRLAGQYISATDAPAAFQVEFSQMLAWMEGNLRLPETIATTTGGSTSMSIPANRWCVAVAVQSATTQAFNVGAMPGGSEYGSLVPVAAGDVSTVALVVFGGSAGNQIYISGLSGVATISILVL